MILAGHKRVMLLLYGHNSPQSVSLQKFKTVALSFLQVEMFSFQKENSWKQKWYWCQESSKL